MAKGLTLWHAHCTPFSCRRGGTSGLSWLTMRRMTRSPRWSIAGDISCRSCTSGPARFGLRTRSTPAFERSPATGPHPLSGRSVVWPGRPRADDAGGSSRCAVVRGPQEFAASSGREVAQRGPATRPEGVASALQERTEGLYGRIDTSPERKRWDSVLPIPRLTPRACMGSVSDGIMHTALISAMPFGRDDLLGRMPMFRVYSVHALACQPAFGVEGRHTAGAGG